MSDELTRVSEVRRQLALAENPDDAKSLEAMAQAARAWAKEQDDFGLYIQASLAWFLSRRKFAELVEPEVRNYLDGRPKKGNNDVTLLADFGLTKMQWQRRKQELEIPESDIEAYVDDCWNIGKEPTVAGLLREHFGLGVHFSSDTNEWTTPPEIISRVVEVLGAIDLDPCADSGLTVPAKHHFTEDDDGLEQPWFGRVYMNPPYGNAIPHWIEKLVGQFESGDVKQAIALVPARTDTEWFRLFRPYPRCFIWGRLKFGGGENSAPFPSMAVYLGESAQNFTSAFESIGDVYGWVGYGSS